MMVFDRWSRARGLKAVTEAILGCRARHKGSKRVVERLNGEIAWEGVVDVFDLTGDVAAKRCYAWSFEEGGCKCMW